MSQSETFQKQALTEHLTDLRRALLRSLMAVGACFVLTYSFSQPLGQWFVAPIFAVLPPDSTLIFISYQEGFFFI
ncbi:MAG: preprotein translocase [Desulfobulbaceae bacterium]|nr:MAG: preprotein translocase [Desulfobulbaceae bacterium]